MMPPMSFSSSSTAKSGDATQGFGSAAGDMNINYGNGVSQGGSMPSTLIYVAAAIAGLLLWKRYT